MQVWDNLKSGAKNLITGTTLLVAASGIGCKANEQNRDRATGPRTQDTSLNTSTGVSSEVADRYRMEQKLSGKSIEELQKMTVEILGNRDPQKRASEYNLMMRVLASESQCVRYVGVLRDLADKYPTMRGDVQNRVESYSRLAAFGGRPDGIALLRWAAKNHPDFADTLAGRVEHTYTNLLGITEVVGRPVAAQEVREIGKAAKAERGHGRRIFDTLMPATTQPQP